ncbi:MAG TPA: Rne/Rng family ribonuclease [Bryobacteraceae bacterium]|nr:Rne/Rng family ribonuclease [Bryobacteraceae bacterium]
MSKELVISANRHETKVALIEDDQLCEVYFQRANEYSLAGSIHKGRVTRVLPGMQSAFVDLGLERDTFLYVSDFLEEHEDFDKVTGDERPAREPRERERRPPQGPPAQAAPQEPVEGAPVEALGAMPAEALIAPSESRRDDRGGENRGDRDRRGRRSRRRRGGGRGFPESKYASPGAEQRQGGPQEAFRTPAGEEAEAAQAVESVAEPASEEITPLILPGESLKKYREGPPALKAEEAIEPIAEEPEPLGEYDEPIHYPAENALPDAPVHAGEAAVEAQEPPVIPPPLPQEYVAAHHQPDELEEKEAAQAAEPEAPDAGNEEEEEGSVPGLDDDEDRDIQAMILGDIEGLDTVDEEGEEIEEAAAGQKSEEKVGEAAVAGETASAAVRDRSGRYPHRGARRNRRRRGGPEAPRQENRSESPEGRAQVQVVARPVQGQPSITDLLKEGQEIIVQIAKEPLGQKGARITSHIALPGRYVVYMPTLEHMGVSRKIGSDEERLRLKRILQGRRPGPVGGFITRTAAEGRSEEDIAGDMQFLYNLWQDIRTRAERKPAPVLLHHDLDIVQRILRDQLADSFKAIWIDNEEHYERVLRFVERFQPALVPKVKLYTREAPIFDAFGVTAELEKALRPKVWLKSGGYIVINQTEALVAIDVNTGKYVGKSNRLEDTIVKTNTEAVKEIVRQVRLRDLGGIIVIDFIDMDERKNRQKVMQALEEAMRADRAPYKILQFNDFGLVAVTRKRVKQSLERTLCSPCPHCEGAGYVKSVQTVISEILTEARKMARSVDSKDVMLRVHPDVAKVLKSHQNKFLEELEETLRRPVLVKSDPLLHHEKFDLA